MGNNKQIPFSKPAMSDREIGAVARVLKSGWITTGPETAKFEKEFGKYIGVKHAVAVNSCTSALHLALLAHGVGEGDEVIVPSLTFVSSANVVEWMGAKPVFVEVDEESLTVDAKDIERKVTRKTKAVIVVHYGGRAADIGAIGKAAKKYNLVIIEDAAHAVGSRYGKKRVGARGNTTAFSFYATKNMTTGEGGMLTTDKANVAKFARLMRLHGMSKDGWKRYTKNGSWKYEVKRPGYKYNMTDMTAALGRLQLKRLDGFVRKQRRLVAEYNKLLNGVNGVKVLTGENMVGHSFHLMSVLVDEKKRDDLIEGMEQRGVEVSVHFQPVHLLEFYRKKYGYSRGSLPVTEELGRRLASLPLYVEMTKADVRQVVKVMLEVLNG